MSKTVKRGYSPNDNKEFGTKALNKLLKAANDLQYLLNHEYNIKSASEFIGNHYLLSERQRLALVRAVSSDESIRIRKHKQLEAITSGSIINIDGFNTIITLEVALSGSILLKCMDGTIRDLAALRGTYRLIDKTDQAILLIGHMLQKYNVSKVVFYLDSQVSNSGRLMQRILELFNQFDYETQVQIIDNVDSVLKNLDNVITSDAIILNKCISWFNLNKAIIDEISTGYPYADFSNRTQL